MLRITRTMTVSYVQGVRMSSALALLAMISSTAIAQSYTRVATTGSFSSISSSGTPISLSNTDDGYGSFSAPFTFMWFGESVFSGDLLYANSNGMLAVAAPQDAHTNVGLPTGSPSNFMAPMWDDLDLASVYYATSGSSGSYVLTVEWSNIAHYNVSGDYANFQIKIYQATGNIEFVYGSSSVVSSASWNATVGLQDANGINYVQESCSPSCSPLDFTSGTVLRFTPGAGPPPSSDLQVSYVDTPPSTVTPGDSYSLFWEVYNGGSNTSASTSIGLYVGLSSNVTTSDFQIASGSVSAIGSGSYGSGSFSATIPSVSSGTYYVAAIVDPSNFVTETNEANNVYPLGTVTISGGGGSITVINDGLPSGTVGSFYSAQLQQFGGSSPTWSLTSGSLPPGLTLTVSGSINGTPSSNGTYSFTVQASESGYTPGSGSFSINIGGGSGPQITTTSIPAATVGVPYSTTISVTGGSPPYGFSLNGQPEWLSISGAEGQLFGTPGSEGSYTLTVTVFDSAEASTTGTFNLEITAPGVLTVATDLPEGHPGDAYSAAIITGGMQPYTITTTGQIPQGLTLDSATGILSGVPSRVGSWTFMVMASDSAGAQISGSVSVTVTMEVGLRITIGDEVPVYTGTDARVALSAEGGTEPYTWSIIQGSLQSGLSLDSSGFIVGRVTLASTATVTFQVTDATSASDTAVVYVRAQPFRTGTGRTGGGRSGGCGCSAEANHDFESGSAALLVMLGVGLALRRRRA